MASTNMIFILLLSSAFSLALNAQQIRYSNISLGSSLSTITGNTSWLSPSGQFAFGYYPQGDGFAIGIWFEKIPEKTVVWSASSQNDDTQVIQVSRNATLLFNNEGWLILRDNFQGQQDWNISSSASEQAASASMLDSGNFVLYNSTSGIIWQSFDSPTNTILQGQHLSNGAELFSSASETDHSKGRFRLKMQRDGNIVQYPIRTPDTAPYAYYSSGTYGSGASVKLNLEDNGHLYLINGTGIKIRILTYGWDNSTNGTPVFYRMTLDVDGIFRVYSLSLDQKGNWSIKWLSSEDKCAPMGLCGVNSFCVLMDQVPQCFCLQGFNFIDQGKKTLGCERNYSVDCRNNKEEDMKITMIDVENIRLEDDAYSIFTSTTEEGCRKACLDDCNCEVVQFHGKECKKQKLPLRYGRRQYDESTITFVKINANQGDLNSNTNQNDQKGETKKRGHSNMEMKIAIAASVAGTLMVFIGIAIFCYLRRRGLTKHCFQCCLRRNKTKDAQKLKLKELLRDHEMLAPKIFKYSDLKKITNSFRDKLGQGGYGSVFKGQLLDGRMVAVKILSETKGNGEEFINEVASISRTSHVNIVPLLGFCIQGRKRALVYEFMPNGSLEKFIFIKGVSSEEANKLEWDGLYKIAVGIARGLEYLHRGCHTRIVHFDIKPHNILLDQDFCPKISDFGLAKLCFKKDSIVSIKGTRGTIGYIAPELVSRNFGGVSHKSDVYSYGMMVLEMVGGRKNVDVEVDNTSEIYFPHWIYKQLDHCEDLGLCRAVTEEEREIARKMTIVGLWCIQIDPSNRPSMNEVLDMLEGSVEDLQIPPKPYLSSPPRPKQASSTTSMS